MKIFDFLTARKISFGENAISQLPEAIKQVLASSKSGRTLLIVTGNSGLTRYPKVEETLASIPEEKLYIKVAQEPTLEIIEAGRRLGKERLTSNLAENIGVVIGIGGGSVLDTAKALAALIPNDKPLLTYLEVIGQGMVIENAPLPVIAIPTTSGTGSEVTKNAVIEASEHGIKVSLRDDGMLPVRAILDPTLTYTLPRKVTAHAGADALTQVIEPFLSHLGTPMTDILSQEGIVLGSRALPEVVKAEHNPSARRDMMFTSLLGGISLANAKLGAVHGFAGIIGGLTQAPHGEICGLLLPAVLEVNYKSLLKQKQHITTKSPLSDATHTALNKFDRLTTLILPDNQGQGQGNLEMRMGRLIEWSKNLVAELPLRSLRELGVNKDDFGKIIPTASISSSMKGNPIKLEEEALEEILSLAF